MDGEHSLFLFYFLVLLHFSNYLNYFSLKFCKRGMKENDLKSLINEDKIHPASAEEDEMRVRRNVLEFLSLFWRDNFRLLKTSQNSEKNRNLHTL